MRVARLRVSTAVVAVALGLLASGCGRRAPAPTRDARATAPPPVDAGAIVTAAVPPDAAPTTAPAPPPVPVLEGPLPAMTFGPPIRLPTVPVVRYRIGGHRIHSIRLADRETQAALDVELATLFVDEADCAITLANPRLVSAVCAGKGSMATMDEVSRVTLQLAIGADHQVTSLPEDALFHPHTAIRDLLGALAADVYSHEVELSISPVGLVRYDLGGEGGDREVTYPWRTLAPYLRADSPLGELLLAAGLPLAPPGTVAAPAPAETAAITRADGAALIADWWRLPPGPRADVRLFVPAAVGDEVYAWLRFPAGATTATVARDLGAAVDRKRLEPALASEPAATLALARTREPAIVRHAIGTRAPIERLLPRGAVVAAARGPVGVTESQLGRGWALVGPAAGPAGWVPGRAVVDEPCAPSAAAGPELELTGTDTWARGGQVLPVAWFITVAADGARTLAIHERAEDCTIGAALRTVTVPGAIADVVLASTGEDGDAGMVIVVVAPAPGDAPRDALVFAGAAPTAGAPDEPIYQRRFERGVVVTTAVTRGRERLPLVLTSGREVIGLRWLAGQLVGPAAPAAAGGPG